MEATTVSQATTVTPVTDSIVLETIENFIKRSEVGLQKYGVNMDRTDLEIVDWIIHSIEEQMDNILYLTKVRRMILKKMNETSEAAVDEMNETRESCEA